MRKFNNYEAVQIKSEEEAMEFLQYLEDNTTLKWSTGEKPTGFSKERLNEIGFPIFFEVYEGDIWFAKLEDGLEDETKVIPITEFVEPKVINN